MGSYYKTLYGEDIKNQIQISTVHVAVNNKYILQRKSIPKRIDYNTYKTKIYSKNYQ